MPPWVPDAVLALGMVAMVLAPIQAFHRARMIWSKERDQLVDDSQAEIGRLTAELADAQARITQIEESRWTSDDLRCKVRRHSPTAGGADRAEDDVEVRVRIERFLNRHG